MEHTTSFSHDHHYAVIVAGGSGTRLWPMSRKNAPKQFQRLIDSQTMLQGMYQLLRELLDPSHIFVQVDKRFKNQVIEQLPELPQENILIEPEARDTGPAIGFATAAVLNRDPEAKLGVFWSDHVIKNKSNFVKALTTAFRAVEDFSDHIVSIGIKPAYAHTGLGYIQMKNEAKAYPEGEVFFVDRFIEKPDRETALTFVKSWEYLWNTGYSIFSAASFFTMLDTVNPELATMFRKISELMSQEGSEEKIAELFMQIERKSIDYMVMEKASNLLVVPSDMEWSDIGDWSSLHAMLSEISGHHMVTRGNHLGVDCENCLVYAGERMIATLGLKNLVIVDTGDAILIADKNSSQDMKKLVQTLEQHDKHMYL